MSRSERRYRTRVMQRRRLRLLRAAGWPWGWHSPEDMTREAGRCRARQLVPWCSREYWSRRPGSCSKWGRASKTRTHRLERRAAAVTIRNALAG